MTQIPVLNPTQPAGSGMVSFAAPSANQSLVSFDNVMKAVGAWAEDSANKLEYEAHEAVKQRDAVAQGNTGAGALAPVEKDLAWRFHEDFIRTAEQVERQQMIVQTQSVLDHLYEEHRYDPEGFSSAVSEYADAQYQKLLELRPTIAEETKSDIQQQGEQVAFRLRQDDYARKMDAQKADYIKNMKSFIDVTGARLRSSPDEGDYYVSLAEMEKQITNGVETHVFGASEAEALRDSFHTTITRDFVEGDFNKSFNRGDYKGCMGVIKDLWHTGKWFDAENGNEIARVVGDRLYAKLKSAAGSGGEVVPEFLAQLRIMQNAVEHEGTVDLNAAEYLLKQIQASGPTPSQMGEARRLAAGIFGGGDLITAIKTIPVDQLPVVRQAVASVERFPTMDSSMKNQLTTLADAEITKANKAMESGDYVSFGGPVNIFTMEPEAYAASLFERQRTVSQRLKVPELYVPLLSDDEVSAIDKGFTDAAARGDQDTLDLLTKNLLAAGGGDPFRTAAITNQLKEGSGHVWIAAQLGSQLDPGSVMLLQKWYSLGLAAGTENNTPVSGLISPDIVVRKSLKDIVRGISLDDARVALDVNDYLATIYKAMEIARTNGDPTAPKDSVDEMKRLLGRFSDVVEFDNGAVLPKQQVPSEAFKREVNNRLSNPATYFNFPKGVDANEIRPMPFGESGVGFYSAAAGRFLTNKKGQPEIVPYAFSDVKAPGLYEEESADKKVAGMGGLLIKGVSVAGKTISDTTVEAALGGLQMLSDRVNSQLDLMTEKAKFDFHKSIDAPELDSLVMAVKQTPVEEKTARLGSDSYAIRLDAEKDIDWNAVKKYGPIPSRNPLKNRNVMGTDRKLVFGKWGDNPAFIKQSIRNPDLQPAIAKALLDTYTKEFGSYRAALAAYWAGGDTARALRKQFGDTWMQHLDLQTVKFIERASNDQ